MLTRKVAAETRTKSTGEVDINKLICIVGNYRLAICKKISLYAGFREKRSMLVADEKSSLTYIHIIVCS